MEQKESFPLSIVGLNSAWTQYSGEKFEGHLALPVEQFHAALGEPGLDRLAGCQQNLLLLHHPPAWLSNSALKGFNEAIYPPDRFTLCLYGHMHAGRSEMAAISVRVRVLWHK